MALLVGMAGLLGDLAESLLKRDLGAKTPAPGCPASAACLDLLDSILFAAPVAWVCWRGLAGLDAVVLTGLSVLNVACESALPMPC